MGLFLSFEGPDGSGKSTQAHLLVEELRRRGFTVTETREPGGTPLGEALRHVLLAPESPEAHPLAMALILSAARAQLVKEIIAPALSEGHIVITDRYVDSTLAYQGFGLGVDLDTLRSLGTIATGGLQPDAVLYVDVPPDVGLERRSRRGEQNRLDAQAQSIHQRVRDGYQHLAHSDPARWISIDGTASPDSIHRVIVKHIERLLSKVASVA